MGRLYGLLAVLLALAGCSGGAPPPVSGTVDLGKPPAATTAAEVFSFTGHVDPPDSVVEVSDGVVRAEPSGRFTVGVASPARGVKRLRVAARHPGRRPWFLDVRLTRGRPASVRVPERDAEAPSAAVLLLPSGSTRQRVQPSPSKAGERPETVRLAEPGFRALAAVRDEAGGTGRVRLSIESETRCGERTRTKVETIPPAQVVNIAIPPGARAPVERQRSAVVRLPTGSGCSVTGEVFAEGTDAHGRQAVTAHIGFRYP